MLYSENPCEDYFASNEGQRDYGLNDLSHAEVDKAENNRHGAYLADNAAVAAETAALSGDASAEHRAAALTFANALGNAFQIKDDILDYAGTDSLGKPVGVDLREQKITLPLLGALEGSPREAEIRQMVGEIPSRPEYCDRIRAFVAERGGISYAVRRLGEWVEQAVRALDVFSDSPAKVYLTDIARFNLWREV